MSNDKDSPAAEKRNQLKAELESIKQQQSAHKSSRGDVQGKIASLDAQLKSRIAEQKNARSRVSWKNVDEIDREIARLEKQVDSGTMKLVDEKKALAEISSLRKQKKGFAGFEDAQKGIDELKSQIADLKKGMDNPEAKALGERYGAVQKELNDLRAEQDDAYKNVKSLRAERNKLHAEQQEKWLALREVKDKYFTGKKAYKQYEDEVYKQRRERQKAERDAFDKEKRRKVAEKKLEEASAPAYLDEILTAESLIRYFDPSANASNTAAGPGKFAAQAQRTVDSSNIKGTRVAKKEEQEDNYFVGSGGKKGKKGKKGGATEEASKFSMNLGVMEELAKVDVTPPSTQADVPGVIEKLKEKLAKWKADQDKQTKAVSSHHHTRHEARLTLSRMLRRLKRRLTSWKKKLKKLQPRQTVRTTLRRNLPLHMPG